MAPQNIGDVVTVRGEAYRLTDYNNVSHLGSKFFGKMSFDLVKLSDGSRWGYCGKRVTVNANLSPIASAEPEPEPETCDHRTGQEGCALPTCQGVPVGVDVHTSETVAAEPVGYETGHAAFGRDMARAMGRYGLSVTLPTTFESRWDRGNVREVSGYDLTANGHAVRIVSYLSRGPLDRSPMSYAAIYVGGQIISSEQTMAGGAAKIGHAIAYAVARHLETLPAPVAEPVAAEVAERVTGADALRAYIGQRITVTTEVTTRQTFHDGPNDETVIRYEPVTRVTSGVLAEVEQRGSVTVAVFAPRFDAAGTWLGTDRHDFGSHQPTTVTVHAAEPEPEAVAEVAEPVAEVPDFSGTVRLAEVPAEIGAEVPEVPADSAEPEPVAPVAEPVRGERKGYNRRVTRTVTNRREAACDWCGQTVPAGRGEARLLDVGGWVVVHPDSRWHGSPVSGGYVGGCPTPEVAEPEPVAGNVPAEPVAVADAAPEVAEPVADAAEVDRSAVADDMWLRARFAWDAGNLADVVTMVNAGEAYAPAHAIPHHGTWSAMLAAVLADIESAYVPAEPESVPEPVAEVPAEPVAERTPLSATVDRDSLADALAFVGKSVARRPNVPVLSGVQLSAEGGRVTVAAFDYDSAREVDVPADDVTAGRVVIGYKSLNDVVKKLPKRARVSLAEVGAAVTVECGRVRLSLPTMPAEDYPTLPAMPDTVGTLPAQVFADMVAPVALSAGTDETLPKLTGVRVEATGRTLAMMSTDRYRLGIRETGWSGESFGAIVPARALAEVAKRYAKIKGGRVTVGCEVTGEGVRFGMVCDRYRVNLRTLDDGSDFVPVRHLVPTDSALVASATVDAADMLGAIERAATACERTAPVRLTFAGGEVTVAGGGGDSAEVAEPVACDWSGGELTIAFNPAYLADGVKAAGTDRVRFRFVSHDRGALIVPAGKGVYGPGDLYLIMPIQRVGSWVPPGSAEPVAEPEPVATVAEPEPTAPAEPVADVAEVAPEPVAEAPEPVAPEPVAEVAAEVGAEVAADAAEPVADSVPEVPAEPAEPEITRACQSLTQRARHAANLRGSDSVRVRYSIETGRVSVKGARPDADMVSAVFGRAYRFDRSESPAYGGHYSYYMPVTAEPVAEVPAEPVGVEVPAEVPAVAEPEPATAEPEPVSVPETGAAIMARVLDAYAAGDLAGALAAVAEGETVAPDYREPGKSGAVYGWADMRANLPAEPVAPVAEPAEVPAEVAEVAEPVADMPAEPEPADVAEVPDVRVWAVWSLNASEVTVIRDRRAGVCGPAGTYPAVTREDAAEVLADAGYTMLGGFRAERGEWVCDLAEVPAGPVDFPMPEPFNAPAAVAGPVADVEPVAPSVPEPVPAEPEPVAPSAVDAHAAIRAQLGRVGSLAASVPAPARVAVPDTAAAVVARWSASDLPVPVSPAPAPVAEPVTSAGPVPAWTYPAGLRVRATLKKDVRPEVARSMRDGGVKVGRVSIVPDRDTRAVAVTLDGVAEGDTPRVWAIVAEVMAAHGFAPAEVAAEV